MVLPFFLPVGQHHHGLLRAGFMCVRAEHRVGALRLVLYIWLAAEIKYRHGASFSWCSILPVYCCSTNLLLYNRINSSLAQSYHNRPVLRYPLFFYFTDFRCIMVTVQTGYQYFWLRQQSQSELLGIMVEVLKERMTSCLNCYSCI